MAIITEKGKTEDEGFLRAIMWKDLKNIQRKLNKEPLYLGIAAKSAQK